MIRFLAFAFFLAVVACGAAAGDAHEARTATKSAGWRGDPCGRDADCNTLWCVNGECEVREP